MKPDPLLYVFKMTTMLSIYYLTMPSKYAKKYTKTRAEQQTDLFCPCLNYFYGHRASVTVRTADYLLHE